MTGLTPAAAIGDSTPPATGPEFNAFVVLPVGVGLPPPPPVAAFSFSPASPQTNVPVAFTDASTGSPTIWQWNFGDGGTSTLRNPTHTFAAAGSYTVRLTATNAGGPSQTTRTVTVTAPPVSSAPTRFFTVNPCRAPRHTEPERAGGRAGARGERDAGLSRSRRVRDSVHGDLGIGERNGHQSFRSGPAADLPGQPPPPVDVGDQLPGGPDPRQQRNGRARDGRDRDGRHQERRGRKRAHRPRRQRVFQVAVRRRA